MAQHRILLTGSRGFVGRVVRERAGADAEIVPLETATGGSIDIRDGQAVAERVRAIAPTAAIHLAAIASPRQAASDPAEAWQVNLIGTFNVARACRREAPNARLVFAGSSEAYGSSFEGIDVALDETAPLKPRSPYGATKAAAEIMLAQMAEEGLAVTRFRPFNHTGAGQSPAYAVSSFARQIVRIEQGLQEPVMRTGNLDVRRDFLDVRDVADAYLAAATATDARANGVFNLATGRPVPVRAVLDGLIALSTATVTVETDPALLRGNDITMIAGDASRARAVFGWVPRYSLEETLRSVLDNWRRMATDSPAALRD